MISKKDFTWTDNIYVQNKYILYNQQLIYFILFQKITVQSVGFLFLVFLQICNFFLAAISTISLNICSFN